jgi:hypothetical protein
MKTVHGTGPKAGGVVATEIGGRFEAGGAVRGAGSGSQWESWSEDMCPWQ